MKILAKGKKNGRTWICGRGTYEEVKSMNIKKDFDSVLDALINIRKNINCLFGTKLGYKIKRNVYGQRKAS